jgi:16S rRNA (adenine1518-N6/adenine1519-N6)-dimethyltransferase
VGNLPYNISTPLIIRLLEYKRVIQDMHFMLQLEVVERLAAAPGSKLWGRLGVLTQYHCEVEALFQVPPEAFYPVPKVQSAVVRLTPHKTPRWPEVDETALGRCVALCFAQRRKTLRNNLKGHIDDEALLQLGIDPGARAETLTIDQFIALVHLIPPPS